MRTSSQQNRQRGFILTSEYILFATILVMGLFVGWVTMRDSFNAELIDTANAIESSIKFYYFNDPTRGGLVFVADSLQFVEAGEDETSYILTYDVDGKIKLPVGVIVSPTGTVTP